MRLLLNDLRLALRMLRRERAFSLVVIATLALALGATTSVFSVVYQVMLRPLPYREPEQLVRLFQSLPRRERIGVSLPALETWRARAQSFSGFEALALQDLTLTGEGAADRLMTARVTPGLFSLLGVRPVLGQPFGPEQAVPGRDAVVLLSHALWQTRYGGDPAVLGRTLTLDGQPHTVTGVLPASFPLRADVMVWKPLAPTAEESSDPDHHFLWVLGRLAPGVPVERARAEMEALAGALVHDPAYGREATGVRIVPLHAQLVERTREQLWLLAAVGGLVLLVACANVANLLLARASVRVREAAVRAALGASGGQLVRQSLAESGVLALVGGAAGLLVAVWGSELLRTFVPDALVNADGAWMQPHVVGVAAGLTLLTCVLFGLVPALLASRADGKGALGDGRGRGATGRGGLRSALVVAQVALALVPLVGAGLMLRTLAALQEAEPGFDPSGVTVGELLLATDRYPDEARRFTAITSLLQQVRALPGVEEAGAATMVPLRGQNGFAPVLLPGEPESAAQTRQPVNFRSVSDAYLSTLRIPLREGRGLTPADGPGAPPVMVVNEAFARRYFPGRSALGGQARLTVEGEALRTVVGVVGDVRHESLAEEPVPEVYLPMGQAWMRRMVLVVRSSRAPADLVPMLREQVRALDPGLPLMQVESMEAVVARSYERTRVLGALFSALAALGLALAGVGLYGVLAYSVSQRTRELGIRMALGATGGQVQGMVVRQGVQLTLLGVAVGLVGAGFLSRALASLLHGVEAFDALTFTAVPALLTGVALLASWLPARRATRVPPSEALRAEG
jgi:putative ABC transport system permease protein